MSVKRQANGKPTIVMVFGTFDILHSGHLYFLRQARRLGDTLVVSVARDIHAKRFKNNAPVFSERDRLALIQSLKGVDQAVLGGIHGYLPHVLKQKPDIIALGYDQTAYGQELQRDIVAGRLRARIVRLKPYQAGKYKSARYKNLIKASH